MLLTLFLCQQNKLFVYTIRQREKIVYDGRQQTLHVHILRFDQIKGNDHIWWEAGAIVWCKKNEIFENKKKSKKAWNVLLYIIWQFLYRIKIEHSGTIFFPRKPYFVGKAGPLPRPSQVRAQTQADVCSFSPSAFPSSSMPLELGLWAPPPLPSKVFACMEAMAAAAWDNSSVDQCVRIDPN